MDEGLSPAELAELPPDLRRIVLMVLREVQVSHAKLSEAMTVPTEDQHMTQADVDTALAELITRGLLARFEDSETVLYRVNLRRRSGGQVIQNILQALGLKSSESGEKSGETGLRRGGNRVLPKSIWDALGETKKSTSEEAETVLNIFQSPTKAEEEKDDKREVTLAHTLWDAVATDEERIAEEAKETLRSQLTRRSLWEALDDESENAEQSETSAEPKMSMDRIRAALSEPAPDKPDKKEVEVQKVVPSEPTPLEKLVADTSDGVPVVTPTSDTYTEAEAKTTPPPPPTLPEETPTPKQSDT